MAFGGMCLLVLSQSVMHTGWCLASVVVCCLVLGVSWWFVLLVVECQSEVCIGWYWVSAGNFCLLVEHV